jgi:hypothetical protein
MDVLLPQFLVTLNILTCYLIVLTTSEIVSHAKSLAASRDSLTSWDDPSRGLKEHWTTEIKSSISDRWPVFVCAIFSFMVFLSVFCLLIYHLNLLRLGETTNESVRGTFTRNINRFNRGFWQNARERLCGPLEESRLDFLTSEVKPDSLPGMSEKSAPLRSSPTYRSYVTTQIAPQGQATAAHLQQRGDLYVVQAHAAYSPPQLRPADIPNGGGHRPAAAGDGSSPYPSYQSSDEYASEERQPAPDTVNSQLASALLSSPKKTSRSDVY